LLVAESTVGSSELLESIERRIGGRGFDDEAVMEAEGVLLFANTSAMGETLGRGEGMGGTGGGGSSTRNEAAEAFASDFYQSRVRLLFFI
jgi:hypothetical protein